MIYDTDGDEVVVPKVFECATTRYISANTLNNGNFSISYRDISNLGYDTFVIYDPDGNVAVTHTVYENANNDYVSAIALNNANFAIAYNDIGNSRYGIFVIYGKSYLALEIVSNNEVRLWNYTTETFELRLSVN